MASVLVTRGCENAHKLDAIFQIQHKLLFLQIFYTYLSFKAIKVTI